ncbi:hypothetical protein OPIT5_19000 [Opitutaceae bacterium TAV5]|nr:hypothetical protein OPIT5_19000 [Opitutaceae bacterium TAV5]
MMIGPEYSPRNTRKDTKNQKDQKTGNPENGLAAAD